MRFLVLSDIHGRDRVARWANHKVYELEADGIIVLGDITHFGPADWAGQFLSKLKAPVYAVPGNCDPPGVIGEIEKHATLLHKKKIKVEGQTFIGLGGSNPTIFETPFEMEEEEIMSSLRPLMERDAILVVHAPPKGINDTTMTGVHVGSTAIRALVDEFHPKAVLAGHIHEARGIVMEHGTLFMNPGPAKESYSGVLEFDGEVRVRMLDKASEE
jgi:Icc-related predicted phosphoesterase